jgi:hypothetical protein
MDLVLIIVIVIVCLLFVGGGGNEIEFISIQDFLIYFLPILNCISVATGGCCYWRRRRATI